MRILTGQEMSRIDQMSASEYGIPTLLLMENAGRGCVDVLRQKVPNLSSKPILIVCGKGNNGGDGFVISRQLLMQGIEPQTILIGDPQEVQGDARINLEILQKRRHPIRAISSLQDWAEASREIRHPQVVVDALLGTGLSKPLGGLHLEVVGWINASDSFCLAVDIPTGMPSEGLTAPENTIRADVTVTFTCPKISHILNPSQDCFGELRILPIGTPDQLLDTLENRVFLMEPGWVQKSLPKLASAVHKGDLGHTVIVAGSPGKTGAAMLAATASLRSGSGLVTCLLPEICQERLPGQPPELMTKSVPGTADGEFSWQDSKTVLSFLSGKQAAALGPGIGCSRETIRFVHQIVEQSPVPLVLDADALNCLTEAPPNLLHESPVPLVLTPHPGEFSRLCQRPLDQVLENRLSLAVDFAKQHSVWLVSKSFRTIVATPDGDSYCCALGNPGMASAGMGDTLTGIITSLLGRRRKRPSRQDITEAVVAGVYLHSLAADLAVQDRSMETLVASDLIGCLSQAFQSLRLHTE